jgi:hypothetical protein
MSTNAREHHKAKALPQPWPPAWAVLPYTIEAIEAGRARQQELFPQQVDDSREGRDMRNRGELFSG